MFEKNYEKDYPTESFCRYCLNNNIDLLPWAKQKYCDCKNAELTSLGCTLADEIYGLGYTDLYED